MVHYSNNCIVIAYLSYTIKLIITWRKTENIEWIDNKIYKKYVVPLCIPAVEELIYLIDVFL